MLYIVTLCNIYHQYTPNVGIYTIHGSYGYPSYTIVSRRSPAVLISVRLTTSTVARWVRLKIGFLYSFKMIIKSYMIIFNTKHIHEFQNDHQFKSESESVFVFGTGILRFSNFHTFQKSWQLEKPPAEAHWFCDYLSLGGGTWWDWLVGHGETGRRWCEKNPIGFMGFNGI